MNVPPVLPPSAGSPDETSRSESSLSGDHPVPMRRPKIRWGWVVGGPLLLALVWLVIYSVYVAFHEADRQETVLLGQTHLAIDAPSGLRIVVRDRVTKRPIRDARITAELHQNDRIINLGKWSTGPDGSPSREIRIPVIPAGDYDLRITVRSPQGMDRIIRRVQLFRPIQLIVSTDKPLYQPGQTIHLRALALNRASRHPLAGERVTFEIQDAKGNKVFKSTSPASRFGIVSADFELATEVNAGRYHVRANLGDAEASQTVEVKLYVLPKFKVTLQPDRPYVRPGEILRGTVQADYFFGRPVARGSVALTVQTVSEQPAVIASLSGALDAEGRWRFELRLPEHFAGTPLDAGHTLLDLTARVCDAARHAEETTRSVVVSARELELTAIPEAGQLVPGLENRVYVLATYPDGKPARCRILAGASKFETDETGVACLTVRPPAAEFQMDIHAQDNEGRTASATLRIDPKQAASPMILRTDRAIYRGAEPVRVTVLATDDRETVFLDAVQDRRTILTTTLSVASHVAQADLSLPPHLAGEVTLHAYRISAMGEDQGCTRRIVVEAAADLTITGTADRTTYRPGDTAKVGLQVTDASGKAAPAALGVSIVDESVFALGEASPGLLKQFLEVESDLLKPRYQIKFAAPAGSRRVGDGSFQTLAYALMTPAPPTSPRFSELLERGYLNPQTIQRIRSLDRSGTLASLRNDPQWGAAAQLLSNQSAHFDVVEATGDAKTERVKRERKEYFDQLWACVGAGGFLLLIFAPPLMYIYRAWKMPRQLAATTQEHYPCDAGFITLVSEPYYQLKLLAVLPFVLYPIGMAFLALIDRWFSFEERWLWGLFSIEALIVVGVCGWQLWKLRSLDAPEKRESRASVQRTIVFFLVQFAMVRAGILAGILTENGALLLWSCLGYIPGTFFALCYSNEVTSRALGDYWRLLPKQTSLLEWAVAVAIIVLMAGLMTPALSRARESARRSSLLNEVRQVDLAMKQLENDREDQGAAASSDAPPPRVRRYFPETLFWQPHVITDDSGRVELTVPLADSITTWRASLDAVDGQGRMGMAQLPIQVFQDFFVDLDLPVSLTLGDEVSIPVACYNYLGVPQTIQLSAQPASWFDIRPVDARRTVRLAPREVTSVYLPIRVKRAGLHRLQVTAQGAKMSDAIERELRVLPSGTRVEQVTNGALRDIATVRFAVPSGSVPDSASLVLKLYPSRFSEIVEGLESVFQMPYGCFEQTSSVTYPNVLALDYLKRTGQIVPEIEIKARKCINAGYQRLLTFEVAGGGFDWFGRAPANVCLTAYGILEFTDMARVHSIDPAVIDRAERWLLQQQQSNGSWETNHRGWTWEGRGSMTAFVAWALAEAGRKSPALDRACAWLRQGVTDQSEPYDLALIATALLARDARDPVGHQALGLLVRRAIQDRDGTACWKSAGRGVMFSGGASLDVETTALCVLALMKGGEQPELVKSALKWISTRKEGNGAWSTTQATILAMRALIAGTQAPLSSRQPSEVAVAINGRPVERIVIPADQQDVMRLVSLTKYLGAGDHVIELRLTPAAELAYQLSGEYWTPQRGPPAKALAAEPLQIDVRYDRTLLAVDDRLRCEVSVRNRSDDGIPMAIVDLGIPAGFELDTGTFVQMQSEGRIERFDFTGNQVILYLRGIPRGETLRFAYSLRARYPLRVEARGARAYEYYQPEHQAAASPVQLTVR